jgi:hypothetical protein
MTKKELKKIKDNLPRKWRSAISFKTGYTVSYIDYVLKGERDENSEGAKAIIRAAAELAEQHKSEKKEIKELINQL